MSLGLVLELKGLSLKAATSQDQMPVRASSDRLIYQQGLFLANLRGKKLADTHASFPIACDVSISLTAFGTLGLFRGGDFSMNLSAGYIVTPKCGDK